MHRMGESSGSLIVNDGMISPALRSILVYEYHV